MIPTNTKKIMLFLTKNTNELGFNINQLSRETKISVGSAFKILRELEKNKIITKTDINNASNYKLNLENQETMKICELILMQERKELKGHAKLYAEELKKYEDAELITIFGSILKNTEFNDVDVLFITNKTKQTMAFCTEISKIRTKPVVPLILKKEDLIKELKNKTDAAINIIKNSVIIKGETAFMEVITNVHKK
ncbi:MAG: hypothetical protein KKF65_02715 [Nanoarchaeota archaeon]|nr:hypothetical protein [Nanoarchaeota archaeon]